ncbi:hypothetical protein ACFOSC_12535 [Streptantibioticus rubrisoli]|uniref:Uncharacterized protein n=1 Tax=Streptantibioticus rubrisoli TaxID=1387313 RepID=A0ABT1P856_9ACTN|nr:hypothetical protein [Streptantibioticus rubrisoli]MCQ4041544.1 hypothetical protein [Streptantibioticus rubrisoli]
MDIAITCDGTNPAQELRLLRQWLPKADPELALDFDKPETSADHLGGELVTEVLTGISATADLMALCAAVAGWVHNRFGRNVDTTPQVQRNPAPDGAATVTTVVVGPVTVTITTAPGEPLPVVSRDDG